MVQLNNGAAVSRSELPDDEYGPITPGSYTAMITESEQRQTKANDGSSYLALKVQISGGDFDGRTLFHNLNLWNKNEKATSIAWKELGRIMYACGKEEVQDDAELFNIPVTITVERDGEYDRIKSFSPLNGAAPVDTSPPFEAPTTAAPAANKKPWE